MVGASLLFRSAVIGAAFFGLRRLEARNPLRPDAHPTRRAARNLGIAGAAALSLMLVEQPLLFVVTRWVGRKRWGVVNLVPLPRPLEIALAIALLDYTLYAWHYLSHKVPFLWRFHLVHHIDENLDATTALRFHFGELGIAAVFRVLQVGLVGAGPAAFRWWQTLTALSVLFHHSNWRLPEHTERTLARFVMTPRLHTIHHSTVADHANSNWSSGLVVWDRLHGTLRTEVPIDDVTIGVPGAASARDVGLFRALLLPFGSAKHDAVLEAAIAQGRAR